MRESEITSRKRELNRLNKNPLISYYDFGHKREFSIHLTEEEAKHILIKYAPELIDTKVEMYTLEPMDRIGTVMYGMSTDSIVTFSLRLPGEIDCFVQSWNNYEDEIYLSKKRSSKLRMVRYIFIGCCLLLVISAVLLINYLYGGEFGWDTRFTEMLMRYRLN